MPPVARPPRRTQRTLGPGGLPYKPATAGLSAAGVDAGDGDDL